MQDSRQIHKISRNAWHENEVFLFEVSTQPYFIFLEIIPKSKSQENSNPENRVYTNIYLYTRSETTETIKYQLSSHVISDIENLPFKIGSLKCVILYRVLDHLEKQSSSKGDTYSKESFINDLYKYLSPDSVLISCVENKMNIPYQIEAIRKRFSDSNPFKGAPHFQEGFVFNKNLFLAENFRSTEAFFLSPGVENPKKSVSCTKEPENIYYFKEISKYIETPGSRKNVIQLTKYILFSFLHSLKISHLLEPAHLFVMKK